MTRKRVHFKTKIFCLIMLSAINCTAWSHGFVGKRFFPGTITVDEPTVSDKIALPIYHTEAPASHGGSTWTTNPKLEVSKRMTTDLQVSISASYLSIDNPGKKTQNGFDNWQVGARYNVYLNKPAESIFSLALNSQIGGTGSQVVNATSTTTLSPEILFGQGFGFLPQTLKYLKPFGFIISIEPNFITTNYSLSSITWGAAIEYSLPYMQEFVSNSKIPIFNYAVPIIEFPFSTCKQGSCSGQTTGNIDPGILFYNQYVQLGIEAIIPANSRTGNKVGGVIQLYLYLDNIFSNNRIGQPLFAEKNVTASS